MISFELYWTCRLMRVSQAIRIPLRLRFHKPIISNVTIKSAYSFEHLDRSICHSVMTLSKYKSDVHSCHLLSSSSSSRKHFLQIINTLGWTRHTHRTKEQSISNQLPLSPIVKTLDQCFGDENLGNISTFVQDTEHGLYKTRPTQQVNCTNAALLSGISTATPPSSPTQTVSSFVAPSTNFGLPFAIS
jgi:hypothetical protein